MIAVNRWKAGVAGILVGAFAASTAAAQIRDRCREDQLTTAEQGKGRNEWAKACKYLEKGDVDFYNRKGLYVVFTTGNQPVVDGAPCIPDLAIQGFCPVGCYHPETPLRFDGEDVPILSASHSVTRVTALAEGSSAEGLKFELQDIETFTVGQTKKPLYWIRIANGRSLGVTHDHPMVLGSGLVVPAEKLAVQDNLLTVNGPSSVLSIDILPYEGQVWNVQPLSEDKLANIHVATGILTGSIRFQNQWASESFRLWQRARVDVSDL